MSQTPKHCKHNEQSILFLLPYGKAKLKIEDSEWKHCIFIEQKFVFSYFTLNTVNMFSCHIILLIILIFFLFQINLENFKSHNFPNLFYLVPFLLSNKYMFQFSPSSPSFHYLITFSVFLGSTDTKLD